MSENTQPVIDQLIDVRQDVDAATLKVVRDIVPKLKPPVVQEVVLAQRHLEDAMARMTRAIDVAEAANAAGKDGSNEG